MEAQIIAGGNGRYGRSFDLQREIGFRTVKRYDHIRKFGLNPDVDATPDEDIWDLGGAYVFPSDAGVAMTVSSSDANDDDGGTGAEGVDIIGLGADGTVKRVTAVMDGQTGVVIGTFSRVFRIIVTGTQTNAGIIYVGSGTVTTGVPANKFAAILAGNNQTHMAIFTIPSNMEGLLINWCASLQGVGTKSATIHPMYRCEGQLLVPKDHALLAQNGETNVVRPYTIGDYLPAFTDVLIRADSASADLVIVAGFEILLKQTTNPTSDPTKGF